MLGEKVVEFGGVLEVARGEGFSQAEEEGAAVQHEAVVSTCKGGRGIEGKTKGSSCWFCKCLRIAGYMALGYGMK